MIIDQQYFALCISLILPTSPLGTGRTELYRDEAEAQLVFARMTPRTQESAVLTITVLFWPKERNSD